MRTGVEAGVVVGAVVVLGHAWQGDGAACAMGIGALLVGVTRVASPDGPSLGAMVGATLAMSVSTVMGSVAVNHSVLLVALLILWGFLGGLLVATGPAGGPIGVMAIVGLVAFGHISRGLPGAGQAALFVALGGAAQTLAACLHRRPAAGPVAAARLYRALGDCAAPAPGEQEELELLTAIVGVEEVLASTAVSTAEHALVRDLGRRARELLDALTRRPPGGTVDAPTRDALRAASDEAAALARTGDAAGKHRLMGGTVVSQASAVVSQLIGAVSARSTAFRHGVRLAVLLVLGWAVAHLLDLPRGYWVPLTAALVLKPEHDGTVVRGGSRIVGTCAGAAVVGFVAVALHPQWAGIAALVTVMTAIGLVTFRSSPAVGIAGYSAAIVLLLGFAASDTAGTAFARVLDALIGGVLAIAVYVLWPGPSIPDLGRAVARALRSERDALADLHRFVTGRGSAGRRRDARAAWAAAVIAEDAVSQAAAGGAQPIDLERARTVVLSLRRLRLAAARLGRSVGRREPPPGASIGRFGEWVEGSLSTFEHDAARLAGARPAGWSRLSGDAWPGVFDEYASEVSDSVDAIAAMLSWPRPERESSAPRGAQISPTSAIPSNRTSVRFTRLD